MNRSSTGDARQDIDLLLIDIWQAHGDIRSILLSALPQTLLRSHNTYYPDPAWRAHHKA
jgi:hypothetical protein